MFVLSRAERASGSRPEVQRARAVMELTMVALDHIRNVHCQPSQTEIGLESRNRRNHESRPVEISCHYRALPSPPWRASSCELMRPAPSQSRSPSSAAATTSSFETQLSTAFDQIGGIESS